MGEIIPYVNLSRINLKEFRYISILLPSQMHSNSAGKSKINVYFAVSRDTGEWMFKASMRNVQIEINKVTGEGHVYILCWILKFPFFTCAAALTPVETEPNKNPMQPTNFVNTWKPHEASSRHGFYPCWAKTASILGITEVNSDLQPELHTMEWNICLNGPVPINNLFPNPSLCHEQQRKKSCPIIHHHPYSIHDTPGQRTQVSHYLQGLVHCFGS